MRKLSLLTALLTFSILAFAAKSYHLTIVAPTKVGSEKLAQGSYILHLEGDKAVFTDGKTTVSVPVKLANGNGKKFEYTSVEATQKDGTEAIQLIHLEGSTTTLQFGD
jgi:hypothetical protein